MVVDAHCHLAPELPAAELVRVMDGAGVTQTVLVARTVDPLPSPGPAFLSPVGPAGRLRYVNLVQDGLVRAGGRVLPVVGRPDNEAVASAVAAYPDRFIALASVNPRLPGCLAEIDRCFNRGFRGVKVHAWHHDVDLARDLPPVAGRCAEAGLPILLHLGGSRRTGLALLELLDRFPTVNFIAAHAGLPYHRALWTAARSYANLYFDLAGPHISPELARLMARSVPPGRVLFASGGPDGLRDAGGGHSYSRPRRCAEEYLGPSPGRQARDAVLGGNLLRLVRLARPTDHWSAAAGNPGGRYSSSPGR